MIKKSQIDFPIISLVVVLITLLLLAPILLKVMISIRNGLSPALGNITTGGAIAQSNFNHVLNTGINMWDKVIMFAFFISVIVMFISALFIDTNPFWIIIYIIICFFLMVFTPNIIESFDTLYNSSTFSTESNLLTFTNLLRNYYGEFLVGLILVTGIIMYGKISLFSGRVRR